MITVKIILAGYYWVNSDNCLVSFFDYVSNSTNSVLKRYANMTIKNYLNNNKNIYLFINCSVFIRCEKIE